MAITVALVYSNVFQGERQLYFACVTCRQLAKSHCCLPNDLYDPEGDGSRTFGRKL